MKELNLIQTKLNAPKNQYNSFGGYNYRNLEDVLEALKPLLKETGCTLLISDRIEEIGGRFYVKATATLVNAEGEEATTTAFAREEETRKGMDGSQITGAASSYARKYALGGLFCIDDNKDADYAKNPETEPAPDKPKKEKKDPIEGLKKEEEKARFTAQSVEEAVEMVKNAKNSRELTAIWTANKEQFGLASDFVRAISLSPVNPKKR